MIVMNEKMLMMLFIAVTLWASEDINLSFLDVSPTHQEISPVLQNQRDPREIKALADAGDPIAQLAYGNILYIGEGVEQNYELGYFYLNKAAEQGVLEAIFNCAQFLSIGLGVECSLSQAFEKMKQAADLGFLEALFLCGEMYLKGEGVEKNREAAYSYYEKSAGKGYKEAQEICEQMRKEGI
ncbi:MAG: hypothetical protein CNLJKLNK_01265 [Holosporales bacterium]